MVLLTHKIHKQNMVVCFEYQWKQIAYFLNKMKNTQTVGGQSLLDANAVLIAGGEVSDGQNHATNNMPFMVAGKAGGYFNTGRIFNTNGNNRMNSHNKTITIDVPCDGNEH